MVGATLLSSKAFVGLRLCDPVALPVVPLLVPPVLVAEFTALPAVLPLLVCCGVDEVPGLDAPCASAKE